MDLLYTVVLPLSIGVISSFVLLMLLFAFMKPCIDISPKIAHLDTAKYVPEFKDSYLIKIVNTSWYTSYDIKVKLEKIQTYGVKNGKNNRLLPLELIAKEVTYIKNKSLLKPDNGQNAYLLRTPENISDILEANDKIRFTLIARHGFSGLTKIFIQDYESISDVEKGHFRSGKTFEIYK